MNPQPQGWPPELRLLMAQLRALQQATGYAPCVPIGRLPL